MRLWGLARPNSSEQASKLEIMEWACCSLESKGSLEPGFFSEDFSTFFEGLQ